MVASFKSQQKNPNNGNLHKNKFTGNKKKNLSTRYAIQKCQVIYGINSVVLFKKKQNKAVPKNKSRGGKPVTRQQTNVI